MMPNSISVVYFSVKTIAFASYSGDAKDMDSFGIAKVISELSHYRV